jgi:inosine-uridine nucleoside N-ribohydrolase
VIRIILDVDTGVDDALAIALAVRHPEVQLEAVLTVAGNVGLALTTRNTLRVLDWLGATSVPVYAGADQPLAGPTFDASQWHGADGLGGAQLPESTRSADKHAVAYLIDRLSHEPGELTLVCTAPLTNLASAVQRQPGIVERVREVVLMGGAARPPGNTTPVAEFNIYADPEAAAIVFDQAWPLTMVGLDVTNRVRLSRSERDNLSRATREAALVYEITRHLFDVRRLDSMALHDPLALAIAIQPDLVTTEDRDVQVETSGSVTRGQTVVDFRPHAPPPRHRTRVCTDVEPDRARALLFDTLRLHG